MIAARGNYVSADTKHQVDRHARDSGTHTVPISAESNRPTATTRIGQPGLHSHDLRHTGNTLTARTGASLRDLMARMGHDSSAAALICQHATSAADRAIAAALDAEIEKARRDE